jgi:hypothetical protein
LQDKYDNNTCFSCSNKNEDDMIANEEIFAGPPVFQADQVQVHCRNKDENAFSNEELDSNSCIHDSTFSSSSQENGFQDDCGSIDNTEDNLIEQHDDEIVDLDLCEGPQLIEDHTQSTFEKDDLCNNNDDGNDTLSAFVIVPNVHSNYCHDQTTVLNSYFDQAAIIQSSLLDHQEMEVFESQSSEILYNHPIYDEYPDDEEEHISFPTCMETYNSSPLFDNYDECNLEVDEKQIIPLSSESSLQQENYQFHYKSNQPVYDSDEEDSWTGDEGDKEGLLEQLISPSYLATDEQQTSEPQYDILEPGKENISSGESVQRIFMQLGQQEEVSLDSENSLSFHDPVVVWLEYFLQEVQNVAAFCVQPNFSSKRKLPIHSLLQKNHYLFIPSFSSKQGMLSNPLFAWLHWKFHIT